MSARFSISKHSAELEYTPVKLAFGVDKINNKLNFCMELGNTPPLKSFCSGSLWKYINGSSQNMIDIKRLNDNHATWVYIIENNISGHIFHKSLFL